MTINYHAEVDGQVGPSPVDELDLIEYRRPSRYYESDTLMPTAVAEFFGLSGKPLLDAVSSWVGDKLMYLPGASQPTDGAIDLFEIQVMATVDELPTDDLAQLVVLG